MFDLKQIKSIHQHFVAELAREVDRVTDEQKLTLVAQRSITNNRDIVARTGNLTRRTRARVVRTAKGRLVKIQNTAKYAWAQDQGSGLHGPKKSRYMIAGNPTLSFMWKGVQMHRRYVMHPGVKPTRFLYNATDSTGRILKGWLITAMQRASKKFR